MGRRENLIDTPNKSLALLASWLRTTRREAGITYEQLAQRTPFSAATLARAASGQSVPKLEVAVAFAEECGGDASAAEYLWTRAFRDRVQVSGGRGQTRTVHISFVRDFSELHEAMLYLYRREGAPSYRELDSRARSRGERIPRSTLGRFLNRANVPSRGFVIAFSRACGVPDGEVEMWGQAWDRAKLPRRARPRIIGVDGGR
ncbi:helix-turn-helix domain-containing protein [Streptomyces antimycoticus]|uniref:helix-turn-helix domain-containing protein n=1 Tax=Streptomyces antimycoticus TaxID=68175 RepID=UPI003806B39A